MEGVRAVTRPAGPLVRNGLLIAALPWLLAGGTGCVFGRPMAEQQILKGDQALAAADFDAALKCYQKAVSLDPTFPDAHTKLGIAYKEFGELDKAESSLLEAVKLAPDQFKPVFELGEVYRLLDKLKQAVRAYLIAIELNPDDFFAHFRLAGCYQQEGNYASAVNEYREALRIDPRNAYAWSNLGTTYDADGDGYQAIFAYKRSLECNVSQPLVLVNLATVYINQERFIAGRKALLAAIRQDPNVSVAFERLGYCYWREGNLEDAGKAYAQALKLDRNNAAAYAGFGVVRMSQFLESPNQVALRREALEAWHRSLELEPDQPKLHELIDKYRIERPSPALDFAAEPIAAPPGPRLQSNP